MPSLVLPGLKSNSGVATGQPGTWSREVHERLLSIGNGIDRDPSKMARTAMDILSIPDVWAQPEMFRIALCDEKSPLYEQSRGQWRGLLALFACAGAKYHRYNLNVKTIDLTRQGDLYDTLRLVPVTTLGGKQKWTKIGIILVDELPVGMLVPSVLVCPGKTVHKQLDKIPWIVNGHFIDPTHKDVHLTAHECGVLVRFLQNAERNLEGDDQDLVGNLKRELKAYLAAVRGIITKRGDSAANLVDTLVEQHLSLTLPGREYAWLNSCWALREADRNIPRSDCVVSLRGDVKSAGDHIKGLVLLDPKLADSLKKHKQEVIVWQATSLRTCDSDPDIIPEIKRNLAAAGYVPVSADDFFSDRLYKLGSGEIDTHSRAFNEYLLPVTPLALSVLTADELRESRHLRISPDPASGGQRVSLSFKVHDQAGNNAKLHTIEKVYSRGELVEQEPPTALSRWPNFQHPDWKLYYVWHDRTPDKFFIRAAWSPEGIKSLLSTRRREADVVGLAAEFRLGDQSAGRSATWLERASKLDIWTLPTAPEALSCGLQEEGGGQVSVGLLLMPLGENFAERGFPAGQRTVGVDFGTTKTMIYWQSGDQAPAIVKFQDRNISPLRMPNDTARDLSHKYFLPHRDVTLPFMTALRLRPAGAATAPSIMLDAFIYFVQEVDQAVDDLQALGALDNIKLNLKWASHGSRNQDPNARRHVGRFFEQLVLQTTAEAFADGTAPHNISWKFSYPEAFDPDQLDQFKEASRTSIKGQIGVVAPQVNSDERQTVGFAAESRSAAIYFHKAMNVSLQNPTVTIDIGGRTSDISIWNNKRLLWRSSVELAGQHILIDFLMSRPTFLHDLIEHMKQDREVRDRYARSFANLEKITDESVKRFSIEVLMGVTPFGNKYLDQFAMITSDDAQRLRLITRFALAGILYFVTSTLRWLKDENVAGFPRADQGLTICLGGRVANLFEKLVPIDGERGISRFLAKAGEGLFSSATVKFSSNPKHEVAYGLVADVTNLNEEATRKQVIVGEPIKVGGNDHAACSVLTVADLKQDLSVTALPSLGQMLKLLSETTGTQVAWTEDLRREIIAQVDGEIREQQQRFRDRDQQRSEAEQWSDAAAASASPDTAILSERAGESTVIEPVYILALRDLLKRLMTGQAKISSGKK